MEKLIHLVRERRSRDGTDLRRQCAEEVLPALRDGDAQGISFHLDDDTVDIAGPVPCPAGELPVRAVISYWLATHDDDARLAPVVRAVGERSDGYLVTESVGAEWGQYRGAARDWDLGERSPGIATVALVHRNPLLDERTFREFWYGHQSPMSERLQPRLRYVRNTVAHPVTPGAPPLEGVVVESWPSAEVVDDIEAFHLGDMTNLDVMLDSVATVFDMPRLRSIAMAEYLY